MFRGTGKDGHGAAPRNALTGHMDEWEALAVDYLDGQLDPEANAAVELHLRECPACAARLQAQRGALTVLRESPLEDPPVELEDKVLGELLFPAKGAATVSRARGDQSPRWSRVWRKRVRPWIPATVAVAALFLALVSYGLYRSTADDSVQFEGTTSVAVATGGAESDRAAEENAAVPSTTAAGTSYAPLGVTTTTAGATTTAVGAGGDTTVTAAVGPENTEAPPEGYATSETTQDRKKMISNLASAEAPAYFMFETPASNDEQSVEVVAQAVEQITTFTGLEPLDDSFTPAGTTFVAFVPRDDATQLVDLLRSIGASLGLVVGLGTEPPGAAADFVAGLVDRKRDFPELSAYRTPQPAVLQWSFTTSTLVPSDGAPRDGETVTPDEAGTHVLVVIFVGG